MFDLCNFTLSELEEACKDYKISEEKCKSKFKHEKIYLISVINGIFNINIIINSPSRQ